MKSRSRKYYQKRKEQSGEKKGSVNNAGYNEETEVTRQQTSKKNPAPPKSQDDPSKDALASQDNTERY
jgi:hypothetical protein